MAGGAMIDSISQYLVEVQRLLDLASRSEIARVIEILLEANRARCRVFIMGNGGSAATASHFACDLGKGAIVPGQPRFQVIALTDNVPLMTAWANDTGYENIFAQQLAGLVQAGDVVIGISGSGNSANVLNAIRLARVRGAVTVGLAGFDGGRLKGLVDVCLHVPSFCMEQVEDLHLVLAHLMCTRIRRVLRDIVDAQWALAWEMAEGGDRTIQTLAERLARTLRVTIASAVTLDEAGAAVVIRGVSPIHSLGSPLRVGRRILLDDAPAHRRVIQEGQALLFRQHERALAILPSELEMTLTSGLKSGALLPLKAADEVVGVVGLGERRAWDRSPFTEEQLQRGLALVAEWAPTVTEWDATAHRPVLTEQRARS